MAEVGVATAAMHLRAAHAVAVIRFGRHVFLVGRLPEAGPAGAGIELVIRAEELGIAAHASVRALVVVVPIDARKSRLRSFLARDVELLRRERVFPLCVR